MSALRVLKEADLKAVLDVPTGIEIVERTFRDLGTRDIFRLSEPAALFGGSGIGKAARYKSKGATLISENVTGIRLISDVAREHGFRSHHMLVVFDDATGAPIGLLNETWLHRFRTALTAVVAAKHLARPESRVLALIGAGSIAAELFPAMTRTFRLDEVRVVARRLESAGAFCRRFASEPARFVAMREPLDALDGADIAITLTLAQSPVVRPGMLSPGAFLCSMGETEEVAFGVLDEADVFVVDDFEYATVLGDIEAWLRGGRIGRAALEARVDGHIGEVVAGTRPFRQNDGQRIFAIVQGMAICDLALARHALTEAERRGLGGSLDLFG
ncbi:MAG: hypothetical protein OXI22_00385 [Defluviicoccus sp.]|nr:hypothetical protein [Defluviicoccus sp.]MDE0382313.1 hypothetical protein [Defluviicoccus sp.]